MAIGSVVQRGAFVFVYNERGGLLTMIGTGGGPDDGLKAYTGATVSLKRGRFNFIYDERGRQLCIIPTG
jgi:hypothetical protein